MQSNAQVKCPVCGGSKWRSVRDYGSFQVVRCVNGCILRHDPLPEQVVGCAPFPEWVADPEPKKTWQYGFACSLIDALRKFKPKGRLLDIGAGCGHLLEAARERGFQVVGIDPCKEAVECARVIYDVEVMEDFFPSDHFDPETLDAAVLSHTLEHVPDPSGVLADVWKILRSSGVVIIAVPNYDSFMRRFRGVRWPGLFPSHHIWQFSQKSVELLLRKNGFTPIFARRDSLEYQRGTGSLPKWLILRTILGIARAFNKGDNLIVFGQKESIGK